MGNAFSKDDYLEFRKFWVECSKRQSKLRKEKDLAHLFCDVSDEWHDAAVGRDFSQLDEVKNLPGSLTESNYVPTLRTLLKMEKAYDAIKQRESDMFKQVVVCKALYRSLGLFLFFIKTDDLTDGQLSLVPGNTILLRHAGEYHKTRFSQSRGAFIVSWGRSHPFSTSIGPCDVYFIPRRVQYENYEKALNRFASRATMRRRLFQNESELVDRVKSEFSAPDKAEMACDLPEAEERMEQLNPHQQRAIMNMVKNTSWPKPYIVFGPPGTGKTRTLAEAIAQIYVRKRGSRILYCASSRICLAQMVAKLEEFNLIPPYHIRELSADEGLESIGMRRIILTTNMSCSTLMDYCQFDYVIVDEAGHAPEVETLLPVSCLKENGCLVLAGDLNQLSAVTVCDQACKLGTSLLERLLTTLDLYKPDETTGQYDCKYVTKLLISYRCDPRILAIPNKLLYDNELECANQTPESILKMMNITNPLQFISVEGRNVQPANSISWYNDEEADRCVDLIVRLYKMGLTPDQIGVISPHILQAKLIHQKLRDKLNAVSDFLAKRFGEVERVKQVKVTEEKSAGNSTEHANAVDMKKSNLGDRWLCKVDSVDSFQSDEREVIIISTVKTPPEVGDQFISDDRRFNVSISRAKWLVFVVGHRDALEKNQGIWREFLESASDEIANWLEQSNSGSNYPFRQSSPLFGKSF